MFPISKMCTPSSPRFRFQAVFSSRPPRRVVRRTDALDEIGFRIATAADPLAEDGLALRVGEARVDDLVEPVSGRAVR